MRRPPEPDDALVAELRAAGCVFAEEEARVLRDAADGDGLRDLVRRRVAGEPLEHLVGWVDFCGARLAVGPGVFVPRRRTELLAELAVEAARACPAPVVVELCCGAAPVAATVLRRVPGARVWAVDLDATAVACAERNLGGRGVALGGDLDQPLPAQLRHRVDVLVANAPYVPTAALSTMPPEARDHEPVWSLDGGADGVVVHRRIAGRADAWLSPRGSLLVETGRDLAPLTGQAMRQAGLRVEVRRDDDREATVVVGTRTGATA